MSRPLALLVLLPLAAVGCGGESGAAAGSAARPPQRVAQTEQYMAAAELERELGSGFRDGLYRLAVMGQKSDDAADLGQSLPTGLLGRVRCVPTGPRPGGGTWRWSCGVRWQDVDGKRRRTRYTVRMPAGGCFSAGATPRRPAPYDATIHTYGEDPLNGIVSARKQC